MIGLATVDDVSKLPFDVEFSFGLLEKKKRQSPGKEGKVTTLQVIKSITIERLQVVSYRHLPRIVWFLLNLPREFYIPASLFLLCRVFPAGTKRLGPCKHVLLCRIPLSHLHRHLVRFQTCKRAIAQFLPSDNIRPPCTRWIGFQGD